MLTKQFKFFLSIFCPALCFFSAGIPLIAQETDSSGVRKETVNSGQENEAASDTGIFLMSKIDYNSKDTMVMDEIGKRMRLYNEAYVSYGDVTLNAGYIELDYENGTAYARYMVDSLGNKVQKPIFSQGGKNFDAYALTYDFNSQQGYIRNVKTSEQEGYAVGVNVKKVGEDVFYSSDFYFSTDEALRGWIDGTGEETDYYIRSNRVKMTAGKSIATGVSQLYLADVPTPLVFPFAFFPLNMEPTSGVIIPAYTTTYEQGFGLVNGGYYLAFNDFLHAQIMADVYTKGSWAMRTSLNYIWKYHFRGSFGFNYSQNVIGEIGLPNYSKSRPWQLTWSHNQDPKFIPDLQLSASVNLSSPGYYENSLDQIYNNNYVNNSTTSSSINIAKRFGNSPFTLQLNASQSQTNASKKMSLTLPRLIFSVSRIYPFKKAGSSGRKWFEKINFGYTLNAENSFSDLDTGMFLKPGMWDHAKNGVTHSIPVSTSYNVLKHFSLGLNFNYTSNWYFSTMQKSWNETDKVLETNRVGGFKALRQFNLGASLSTVLYGTYTFKKDNNLKAIRHIITPSLSYSFRPDFSTDFWNYYYAVQTGDRLGAIQHYSYFEGGLGSAPAWNSMSQSMSFNLANNFEAKVQDPADSLKTKKVKLLDQLQTSISYNFAAKEFKLSDIPVSGGTSFFNGKVRWNFRLNFSPYKVDENYRLINEYTLPRLTQAGMDISFSISDTDFKKKDKEESKEDKNRISDSYGTYNRDGYLEYAPTWSLSVGYIYSYTKTSLKPNVVNSLNLNGSLGFTRNWSVRFDTSFDFSSKKIGDLNLGFARQLNTWNFSFSWRPISTYYSTYTFFIGVKAGILRDLKYDQQNNYRPSFF